MFVSEDQADLVLALIRNAARIRMDELENESPSSLIGLDSPARVMRCVLYVGDKPPGAMLRKK